MVQLLVREGEEAVVADDYVVSEREAAGSAGLVQGFGLLDVGFARTGIAAGVIVQHDYA